MPAQHQTQMAVHVRKSNRGMKQQSINKAKQIAVATSTNHDAGTLDGPSAGSDTSRLGKRSVENMRLLLLVGLAHRALLASSDGMPKPPRFPGNDPCLTC